MQPPSLQVCTLIKIFPIAYICIAIFLRAKGRDIIRVRQFSTKRRRVFPFFFPLFLSPMSSPTEIDECLTHRARKHGGGGREKEQREREEGKGKRITVCIDLAPRDSRQD